MRRFGFDYLEIGVFGMGIYDREYSRDEDDSPGFHLGLGRSAVTTLVIVNVVAYLADTLLANGENQSHRDGHWLNQMMSVTPDTLTKPWLWWKFVTYGFAHDPRNAMHILLNMLALWSFGRTLEERYGRKEFLRFYLLAVVAGGVAWALKEQLSPLWHASALMGASGAVTAVILLFVLLYPHQTVLLMAVIPAPAWVMGVIMIVGNLFGARLPTERGEQVAYDVHLVGAAFAAAYYYFGWNLSRSTSSLDWLSQLPKKAKRMVKAKPDLRIHQPEDFESYRELDEEADRILAKLHDEGEGSLTPQERRILEDYSRRMRQKHR